MVVEVRGTTYFMDKHLIKRWNDLKDGRLAKYDEDRFYIVDGAEGSGKSLFTIQQAAYIDPTILDDDKDEMLPRICFSVEEFLRAVRNNKSTKEHTKVVIFDEAFRGLSSKASLSKNNKMLVQCLMEARQNNLIVFIVSPSFYLLEFYAAVLRSQALFHVIKEKKTRLRYVRAFNKNAKARLYQIGIRKGWGYPLKTKQRFRFFNIYPSGAEFEKRYRKKKSENFGSDTGRSRKEKNALDKAESLLNQRKVLVYILKNLSNKSYAWISKEAEKYKVSIPLHVVRGDFEEMDDKYGKKITEDELEQRTKALLAENIDEPEEKEPIKSKAALVESVLLKNQFLGA